MTGQWWRYLEQQVRSDGRRNSTRVDVWARMAEVVGLGPEAFEGAGLLDIADELRRQRGLPLAPRSGTYEHSVLACLVDLKMVHDRHSPEIFRAALGVLGYGDNSPPVGRRGTRRLRAT